MKIKIKIILCLLVITFTLNVILIAKRPKDYIVYYDLDGYKIQEAYYKDNKAYYFSANKDDDIYEIIVYSKYINKKRFINKITTLNDENIKCIYMNSSIIETYPTCKKDDTYIAYTTLNIKNDNFFTVTNTKSKEEIFGNIKLSNINDKKIAIWNHKGFDYINESFKKNIIPLDKETYRDNYSFIVDKYIILPNYDEQYHFNKVYVIDLTNGNYNTWNLDYYINYDFYVLGIHNKKVYIVDKKDKIEYELDPNSKKITIISKNGTGKIWIDKWQEESIIKLSNDNYSFKDNNIFNYTIIDNKLYMNTLINNNILITDRKVDKIIKVDNSIVYYLSNDKLYYFSFYTGEKQMIEYYELSFNKGTSIYIY